MLIGDVAAAVGLPTRTVRFYERRGLLPEPRRAANGYRTYDDTMISRLRFIRTAQAAGLTLSEIARVIEIRDDGLVPCGHVEQLLRDKLDDVRRRRRELDDLERDLEQLVARSRALDPADCSDADVCHILVRAGQEAPPRTTRTT